MNRDPAPRRIFLLPAAAATAVSLFAFFDVENQGPLSVRQMVWIFLILLVLLETFIALETWLAYRTRRWRATVFLPMAFRRHYGRQSERYWYRASLTGGTVALLACGALIAVLGAGLWKGAY